MIKRKTINKAFTMAEILIVIAIIGVIATLTVPNISKDVDEQNYISLLKATMSQVNTAIAAVIAQYGSIENAAAISCPAGLSGMRCFAAKVADKMDVSLNCGTTPTNCINPTVYAIDGTTTSFSPDSRYAFILSNGVSVAFNNGAAYDNKFVYIDLDGPKNGYTKKGLDVFYFKLTNDGLEFLTGDERTYDAAFRKNVDEAAWAFYVGNMDYLKCYNSLKWQTKETCD